MNSYPRKLNTNKDCLLKSLSIKISYPENNFSLYFLTLNYYLIYYNSALAGEPRRHYWFHSMLIPISELMKRLFGIFERNYTPNPLHGVKRKPLPESTFPGNDNYGGNSHQAFILPDSSCINSPMSRGGRFFSFLPRGLQVVRKLPGDFPRGLQALRKLQGGHKGYGYFYRLISDQRAVIVHCRNPGSLQASG